MPLNYRAKLATFINNSQINEQRATQKAISRWFDLNPSANAPDIYQPEWRERIASWQKCTGDKPLSPTTDILEDYDLWLLELTFSSNFFVAHPIASIYLWNLLQALYELDKAVCKDSDAVVMWRELTPFFKATNVEHKWQDSLKELKRRILHHKISSEELVGRLYEIRCSVDKVDETLAELKENFLGNPKDEVLGDLMDDIKRAVHWRFDEIDKSLELSKGDLEIAKETAEKKRIVQEQYLDNSFQNMDISLEFQPRMLSRGSRRKSMKDYVMILINAPQSLTFLCIILVAFLIAYFIRSTISPPQ